MKKALIAMAVHDTEENGRSEYTWETLQETIKLQLKEHSIRVVIVDNNSCAETKGIIKDFALRFDGTGFVNVITNDTNIGTAEAINKAIALRKPGEHVIKIDNDVLVNSRTWALDMVDAVERRPMEIGVLGLKRRDLEQRPGHETPFFRSYLHMLPHQPGQKWFVFEQADDIMGTCTLLPWWLLDKVGYMRQPGVYGYDDVDMCIRSNQAGFANGFLAGVDIIHMDKGGTEYTEWKIKEAQRQGDAFHALKTGYENGTVPIYYKPEHL